MGECRPMICENIWVLCWWVGVVVDSASECVVLVGVRDWLDGSVPVLGGLRALRTQLESNNSWLM